MSTQPPNPPDQDLAPNRRAWARSPYAVPTVCVCLVAAVAAIFGPAVACDFVNFDDNLYVYENPQVTHALSDQGIAWAFTTTYTANWHPLTWLSLMLDAQLSGGAAGGFHLTNVLLHAAAAVVLFLALQRLTDRFWPCAFAAALFAVHPLRTESVAWVAERKDVLSGLFFALALWAYGGYARRRRRAMWQYAAVLACYALGLMSKPSMVTLPLVLLLLDYWPLGRFSPAAGEEDGKFARAARLAAEKAPLFILAAASCAATLYAQTSAIAPFDELPLPTRLANAAVAYVAYLGDFFWPTKLAVFYPFQAWNAWQVSGAVLLLAAITAAAMAFRRRWPYLFVGWFWYLLVLAPMIGLVQVGSQARADRYTYLPHIGICIALAWGARQFAQSRPNLRWACAAAAVAALVLFGVCARRQTAYWRNSESLWNHALECTVGNYVAHNNLGGVLARRGQLDDAIAHYHKALKIRPNYADALFSLGVSMQQLEKIDDAVAYFRQVLELKPSYAAAYNSLGMILAARGGLDADAVADFRRAVEIDPDYAGAQNNLGAALTRLGKIDEAIPHFAKALEVNPDYVDAHYNLGVALSAKGQFEDAALEFEQVLKSAPDHADAHNNLGHILANYGHFVDAVKHFREAIKAQPNHVNAHYNMGAALRRQGKTAAAMREWREVLKLQPGHIGVLNQVAWMLATSPDKDIRNGAKALRFAQQAVQLTGGREPAALATLAAAYAESGRFSEAVENAQRALAIASDRNDSALVESLQAQLKLYRAGSPYHEESELLWPAKRSSEKSEKQ